MDFHGWASFCLTEHFSDYQELFFDRLITSERLHSVIDAPPLYCRDPRDLYFHAHRIVAFVAHRLRQRDVDTFGVDLCHGPDTVPEVSTVGPADIDGISDRETILEVGDNSVLGCVHRTPLVSVSASWISSRRFFLSSRVQTLPDWASSRSISLVASSPLACAIGSKLGLNGAGGLFHRCSKWSASGSVVIGQRQWLQLPQCGQMCMSGSRGIIVGSFLP